MKKRCGAAGDGGFTLMEVLVVLVITSLVTTILMQALSQSYSLQRRFGVQLQRSETGAMQADWFRQIVQGLQPDLPEGPGRLRGDGRSFAGIVTGPIDPLRGASHRVQVALQEEARSDRTRLVLRTPQGDLTIADWPGLGEAVFVYVDAQGLPHDRWPPALGDWPALPGAIELRLRGAEHEELLVAVPRISAKPQPAGDSFQLFAP